MKRKRYLLLLLVVIVAFWQVFFLQNGMKWDFGDAFLPSRYFFSESILNNQFPFWNPYILYGTPIYADLVSVFNPEFWIVGNMFGYTNITLQFMYLVYIFVAGVSFFYFLKQFNTERKFSLALSVVYMLSGFSIGNAQHLAFISGYAIIPFVLASYFIFINRINKHNLIRLSIVLFLMIYCSYPALTIILGYFLLSIFSYKLIVKRADKKYLKKFFVYHSGLILIVFLSGSVLILAYFQLTPFLSRLGGLPAVLAQKHPFSVQSALSFLLPMATGNDVGYFRTDVSMSNAYFGIVSLVFLLFSLTKKVKYKNSYVILFFGIFSLLASFGGQFFLRGFLYKFAPLLDMFQYPSIFRAFTIFSFLAFIGININPNTFNKTDKKALSIISLTIIFVLLVLIWRASGQIDNFVFFNTEKNFVDELFSATRFDNIIFQGAIQIVILLIFILIIRKVKSIKQQLTALLFLFIFDGVVATQLNIYYTVVGETDPINFSKYIKSSPKGFPIPDLNPIEQNSDKNAANEFTWINNNVFPKKITFDGLVSFKLNGYNFLADNHPDLLAAIKKEAAIYFSDDIRKNSSIKNFNTNTVFLPAADYQILQKKNLQSSKNDKLSIRSFAPTKIEINIETGHPQLLTYQQNYYKGWAVFVDGEKQNLLKSNFTHMAVFVPQGEHTVVFKYTNNGIIYTFVFSVSILIVLIAFSIRYYITGHPNKKKQVVIILATCVLGFILVSCINRYFYKKNKLGLTTVIVEKAEQWKKKYNNNIRILLSTHQQKLKSLVDADKVCFIDEKTNLSELSSFLMNSESKYFAFAWQGAIINENILELIYSFYPKVIDCENNNNSGLMLLEKEETSQNYPFVRNFEKESSAEWNSENQRIKTDSIGKNQTYYFDSTDEWGTTLEIPVNKKLTTLEKICVITDFMIEEKVIEILLVFSSQHNGKTNLYQVSKINQFASYPGQWNRAAFLVNVDNKLQEGDKIKVYFWNKNKGRFQIDNLKLKFYYSE